VTVPSLLLIVVLAGGMTASLGVALLWRSKVALHLRIDRCVESAATELERIQGAIESSNARMKAERAAAAAAAIPSGGASIEAAKPVLVAEVVLQESLRMKWRTRQATWIVRRGCDGKPDAFLPLPNLSWWRPPDDPIGPMPLEWKGGKSSGLAIRLWRSNRYSSARVAGDGSTHWKARWAK
jgi:hypothetical protein